MVLDHFQCWDLWFHQVDGVVIENVVSEGELVTVWARTAVERAGCPACGTLSARVHSRYVRRLADSAIGGRPVLIELGTAVPMRRTCL